jgi:hypothetical protein
LYLIDGQGQPPALDLLDSLIAAGVTCGGFIDNENNLAGRRARITAASITFVWNGVRNIEEAVANGLAVDALRAVPEWASEANSVEARHYVTQMRNVIPGAAANDVEALIAQHSEATVRTALATAMCQHGWFKSRHGGQVLARNLLQLGVPPALEAQLAPFVQRLRDALT